LLNFIAAITKNERKKAINSKRSGAVVGHLDGYCAALGIPGQNPLQMKKEEDKKTSTHKEELVSLKKAIQRGGFIYNLEGSDIFSVLKSAVDKINFPEGTDRELVFNELINREEIASTGIGKGVAIPHPRTALNLNLENPVIPVVFLKQPVDFNAVDGKDIFVLFFMFSPSTQIHLKMLARLSICLRDKEFLSLLKNRAGENEILGKIEQIEKELEHRES
jgi:PTS system nitrogen regulatory IIA component